ncbi:hypothetical protein SLEP1_g33075 [Rubroshorea leprosula]|uniref:BHLH domain-containing protein n=1 Tax=Rubroshorea leprosula TaxID=152421 RepID=A0AAV5KFG9_9ROSI|nr:hypothetical protein SLEP1_g33075 [Rubroshorea leprosula]
MAEEAQEFNGTKMAYQLANLTSMHNRDIQELVWENGQVLLRGLSKITQKNPHQTADSVSGNSLGLSQLTNSDHRDKFGSSHRNRMHNNSLQDKYQELSSKLYHNNFNVILEHQRSCYSKQFMDSQVVPAQKFANYKHDRGCYDEQPVDSQVVPFANYKQDYASKFVERIPQYKTKSNSQVPQSSLQQCQDSAPSKKSLVNSNQTAVSLGGRRQLNFEEQNSGNIDKGVRGNVSFLFKSPGLLKDENPSRCAVRPISSPGLSGDKDLKAPRNSIPVNSIPDDGAKSVRNFQNEPHSLPTKLKPTQSDPEPPNESVPDEQSAAIGHGEDPANKRSPNQVHGSSLGLTPKTSKENPADRECNQQLVASSSICSLEASNNPEHSLKRKHDDTEWSADISENGSEELDGKMKTVPAQGTKGTKRNRNANVHNLSEKKRRDKINKKMRALQELIPSCIKVDKTAMLDVAIEYIKTLQLQVQMMSMASSIYMPPLMLPTTMQHINTPHLAGMDMRMQMPPGFYPVQFPASSISGATAPAGVTEARPNMLRCPGQFQPMSISPSPFVSFPGRSSSQSVPTVDTCQVAAPMELQCSAPPSLEKKSELKKPCQKGRNRKSKRINEVQKND